MSPRPDRAAGRSRPTSRRRRRRADRARWADADRAARPARLARLRARFAAAGIDAYFGVRPRAHALPDRASPSPTARRRSPATRASSSSAATRSSSWPTRATRSRPRREAPEARIVEVYSDLPARWPELVGVGRGATGRGRGRVRPARDLATPRGGRAGRRARPGRGLGRGGSGDQGAGRARARRRRLRGRRSGAGRRCCPRSGPGATEADLALRPRMADADRRRRGARLRRRLPGRAPRRPCRTASPGDRPVRTGTVLLFDFGAQVAGYRSDMTRTLFVGEPTRARPRRSTSWSRGPRRPRSRPIEATVDGGAATVRPLPSGRAIDAIARGVIDDGRPRPRTSGTGLGHGIGLATHEAPSLGRRALGRRRCPARRSSRSSPGVYLEGETGVRIEDLVAARCVGRPARAPDPVPARGRVVVGGLSGRRGHGSSATIGARTVPDRPPSLRASGDRPPAAVAPRSPPHDQHR